MNFKVFFSSVFIFFFLSFFLLASNKTCLFKFVSFPDIKLKIEIADTNQSRTEGLMFRKHLPQHSGMLFIFDQSSKLNFWMKNTYLPLSIAYIDKKGFIKEIYKMKPLDISITYPSIHKVKYALEVNKGWFSKNKIKVGNRIDLNGCIGK